MHAGKQTHQIQANQISAVGARTPSYSISLIKAVLPPARPAFATVTASSSSSCRCSDRCSASSSTTDTTSIKSSRSSMAAAAAPTQKECWIWRCSQCQQECVPIRSQSRCMCGHRLAAHTSQQHGCSSCPCPRFRFIIAEGAWILKCRCKHKHTDHAAGAPHACAKASCSCAGFDSPWVCNCDHPWAAHEQLLVSKQVMRLEHMVAQAHHQQQQQQPHQPQATAAAAAAAPAAVLAERDLVCEVNRFDRLQRGKHWDPAELPN